MGILIINLKNKTSHDLSGHLEVKDLIRRRVHILRYQSLKPGETGSWGLRSSASLYSVTRVRGNPISVRPRIMRSPFNPFVPKVIEGEIVSAMIAVRASRLVIQ